MKEVNGIQVLERMCTVTQLSFAKFENSRSEIKMVAVSSAEQVSDVMSVSGVGCL